MKPVAIMAGAGMMPVLGAAGARAQGREVFIVDIGPEANELLEPAGEGHCRIPIWRYGEVMDALRERGVTDVYILGKVPATLIADERLDGAARAVLARAGKKTEHEVIAAFVQDMAERGLAVRSQVELLRPLLAPRGLAVGAERLTPSHWQDVAFGRDVACALAEHVNAGQTAVVKGGLVLALEAVEGTDAAIRRGGALGGPGAIVVKVKGRRDSDFDLPVVGPDTMRAVADIGAAALAVEAERVFLLEREAIAALAEEAGVAFVAVEGGKPA